MTMSICSFFRFAEAGPDWKTRYPTHNIEGVHLESLQQVLRKFAIGQYDFFEDQIGQYELLPYLNQEIQARHEAAFFSQSFCGNTERQNR